MNAQLQVNPKVSWLRVAIGAVVFIAAWAAASFVILLGFWMLVIGDKESRWYWLAPLLGVVVAGGAAMVFRRLGKKSLWRAFALTLIVIVVCFFAGWGLVVALDEGF
jgi:ABC-type iron transport system FetAB permease component